MGRIFPKLAAAAGAAALAGLPFAAQAAVTYSFVADSSFPGFVDETYSGAFTVTVDAPITTATVFQPADLTSCSVTASDGTTATCIDQKFDPDFYGYASVSFGLFDPDAAAKAQDGVYPGDTHFLYYFDPGAFLANGVYETVIFGSDQHGVLTVSGIADTGGGGPGPGVPEPATWALMILGFGAAGTALRRRRPVAA